MMTVDDWQTIGVVLAVVLGVVATILEAIEMAMLRKTLRELLAPVRLGQIILAAIEGFMLKLKGEGNNVAGEVIEGVAGLAMDKTLSFAPKRYREAIKGVLALMGTLNGVKAGATSPSPTHKQTDREFYHRPG